MAYGRRYWRRYWRRYYRGRYSSYGKTKMSKNFKASASNMTQGGTFNISVRFEDSVILNNEAAKNKEIDIGGKIAASDMHTYLSNVFDQYRIEKLTIRLKPIGDNSATITNPAVLFTAMDRTSFANGTTMAQIRTYGSYKETMISGSKDISPTHVCYIGQSNLVEWSTYTDTKNKASFPHLVWGVNYASAETITTSVSVEIDAMVRYRGVRLDTRAVSQ